MLRIIIVTCLALSGCSDPIPDSIRVLEDQGYTNIQITGRGFVGCGRDDAYNVEFIAVSQIGRKVSGNVCSGLFFKGYTIRLN